MIPLLHIQGHFYLCEVTIPGFSGDRTHARERELLVTHWVTMTVSYLLTHCWRGECLAIVRCDTDAHGHYSGDTITTRANTSRLLRNLQYSRENMFCMYVCLSVPMHYANTQECGDRDTWDTKAERKDEKCKAIEIKEGQRKTQKREKNTFTYAIEMNSLHHINFIILFIHHSSVWQTKKKRWRKRKRGRRWKKGTGQNKRSEYQWLMRQMLLISENERFM